MNTVIDLANETLVIGRIRKIKPTQHDRSILLLGRLALGKPGYLPVDWRPTELVRLFDRRGEMKYRVAGWAVLGFLVAAGWGVYFGMRSKEIPIDPIVSFLTRLTCPIGILGSHFPLSLYWVIVANAATYALVGLIVEAVRQQLSHPQ